MPSFSLAYVTSHALYIGSRATISCSTSPSSSSSPASHYLQIRRPGTLCDAALTALEEVYTTRNALPQTGGCAHLLGRLSSETRDAALSRIASVFGSSADSVSVHLSETEPILAILGALKIRKREEILLGLHDDPTFTAPLHAHVLSLGGIVRWVAPGDTGAYAFEQVADAISSRTRLVALQMLSPLRGCALSGEDDPLFQALRFARGAGVFITLDATHGVAAGFVNTPELPADMVVCGAAGIRGHLGAGVAVRNGKRVVLNALRDVDESGVCANTSTAALVSFAAAIDSVRDGTFMVSNSKCANALTATLEKIPGVEVLGRVQQPRVVPVVSMRGNDVCLKNLGKTFWTTNPSDAAAAKLRVLKPFDEGRGKKRATRPSLLCMEFSAFTHSETDIVRVVEKLGEEASRTKGLAQEMQR